MERGVQLGLDGVDIQLQPVRHTKLLVDRREVNAERVLGHEQPCASVLFGAPLPSTTARMTCRSFCLRLASLASYGFTFTGFLGEVSSENTRSFLTPAAIRVVRIVMPMLAGQ